VVEEERIGSMWSFKLLWLREGCLEEEGGALRGWGAGAWRAACVEREGVWNGGVDVWEGGWSGGLSDWEGGWSGGLNVWEGVAGEGPSSRTF
jgi:hypothetical protein